MQYVVIAFASTHWAIRTEKHLKTRFPVLMMPTPRSITTACGISVRFAPEYLPGIEAAMDELQIGRELYAIYGIYQDGRTEKIS